MSILLSMNHPCVVEMTREMLRNGLDIKWVITGYTRRFESSKPKDIILYDIRDFRFEHRILQLCYNTNLCLSESILSDYIDCEREYLYITDRVKLAPISIRERRQVFKKLLLYWLLFFENNPSLSLIILQSSPHIGYDVVLSHIAARNDIPVIYFEPTRIGETYFIEYVSKSSSYIPRRCFNKIGNDYSESNNSIVVESMLTRFGTESRILETGKENCERGAKDFKTLGQKFASMEFTDIPRSIKSIFKLIFAMSRKRSLIYSDFDGGEMPIWRIKYHTIKYLPVLRLLRKKYRQMLSPVDYNLPYAYFAMHLQPERTTSPYLAGIFEDQILAIEVISKSLPGDWLLYVKENPMSFYNGFLATDDAMLLHSVGKKHYRSIQDYIRIEKLSNVKVVDVSESSAKLIRSAIFSSTITGSVGWESLLAGKPCITFGKSWYGDLDSCYPVTSIDECREAIEQIRKNELVNVESELTAIIKDKATQVVDLPKFMDLIYSESEQKKWGKYYGEVISNTLHNMKEIESSKVKGLR
ncbi:MAG: hypothetical protein OEX19_00140 [Gammaproteobacteria bacterium]|nr:hypothetical protein [Gammaproteobacteria bacterium]